MKSTELGNSEQQLCSMYVEQQHSDYIIADYMDKIATRINILETELKFAWSALDLLSGEYGKMWTRLEKLENISMEQKSVVANLMGLYGATSMNIGRVPTFQSCDKDITYPAASNSKMATAAEFNEIMGQLRNEALGTYDTVDGAQKKFLNYERDHALFRDNGDNINLNNTMAANRISADIMQLQEQQKQIEQNIQNNERLFDELNALSYPTQSSMSDLMVNPNTLNANSLRDFLGSSCIKDGLEEGIDLIQREHLKQQFETDPLKMSPANWYMFRDLMQNEAQNIRSNAEFFRSGELNRDLHSNPNEAANIFQEMIAIEQMGMSRPVSSLGMIYEDNEEQELEHQSSASEVDELLLFSSGQKVMASDALTSCPTKEKVQTKKSKKKKHRKHESGALENYKSILNENGDMIDGTDIKKERPIAPIQMTKDETVLFILEEIGKIEDTSLFTSDQINALKDLINAEFTFFNRINQNNKHLLLILLNPIGTSDMCESAQHRCDLLKQKLHKNMEILRKMLDDKDDLSDIRPNEIDIDEILDTASSIVDDDRSDRTTSLSNDVLSKSLSKRYEPIVSTADGFHSQHLMRHNYSLNEQLKLLNKKESEMMCKRSIKSITEELEATERRNLLDNFDEKAILNDGNRTQSLGQFPPIRNDLNQYASNTSIYSNDEYIKSLKKSLERHNSMLFLLHLQNSNYQSSNDIRGDTKEMSSSKFIERMNSIRIIRMFIDVIMKFSDLQMIDDDSHDNMQSSPPPPAPNGEHPIDYQQILNQQQQSVQQSMRTWNPFHTDIIAQSNQSMQNELIHSTQLSSMNPFHADLMKQQVRYINLIYY